jgi:hypothetical protein
MPWTKNEVVAVCSVAALSAAAYKIYRELGALREDLRNENARREVEDEHRVSSRRVDTRASKARSMSPLGRRTSSYGSKEPTGQEEFPSSLVADHPIHRVCLTGGPCAGKTTALSVISDRLGSLGFRVFMVPEAATLLRKAGCIIANAFACGAYRIDFQRSLLETQIA